MRRDTSAALRSIAGAAGVAGALLVMSGCDDTDGAGSSTAAPAGAEAPDEQDSEAGSAEADTGSSSGTTGAACLPGNWYLDNQEFSALMEGPSGGVVDDVEGTVMLTLGTDGTTQTHYDHWSHTITVDDSTVTIVKDGTDSGTYQVTGDGTMSIVETKVESTTTSKMTLSGQTVTTGTQPEPSVFSEAAFSCSGDELTVTADGASTVMHREH